MQNYEISFYETNSGSSPPLKFLDQLRRKQPKAWTKCMDYLDLLGEHGWDLVTRYQYAEKIEADLWVLRPEWSNVEYRLFFTWDKKEQQFVILDAIVKKTKQLTEPAKKRARARAREVQNG